MLRLSRGMTLKSSLAGLKLGGGKAVIIGDPHTGKSQALLHAMGDFVDSLGGRYITAADSGTGDAEMQAFAQRTRHVVGATPRTCSTAASPAATRRRLPPTASSSASRKRCASASVATS